MTDAAEAGFDGFPVRAIVDGEVRDDRAIRADELARARHALAYLKERIGDAAMRALLADDIARTTRQVREWVERSDGRWRSAQIELVVPGPPADAFHRWYRRAMADRREVVLRAGHPEHFVLHPEGGDIEVVENIGETALPWRVFYRSLPDDAFPRPWHDDYPVRFGAEIVDGDGLRVGYTMHHARDEADGMHLLLRTLLPEAAPASLVDRHLHHFAIEFTNWTHIAWREAGDGSSHEGR